MDNTKIDFCPNCGFLIFKNDNFCSHCGEKLKTKKVKIKIADGTKCKKDIDKFNIGNTWKE